MITWSDDINMNRICEGMDKHLVHFKMKEYYIFGLQQNDRPHVRLSPPCPKSLAGLFERSGYILEIRDTAHKYCSDCDENHSTGNCHCSEGYCKFCNPDVVAIGLRRDVRNDITVCRKLIKTVIFAVENKLVVENNAKLNLGRRVYRTLVKKEEKGGKRSSVLGLFVNPVLEWAEEYRKRHSKTI